MGKVVDRDVEVVRLHSDVWSTSGLTGTLALWKAGSTGEARPGGRFGHQIRVKNVQNLKITIVLQVRDEYRTDFDSGRGGYGKIVQQKLETPDGLL